MDRSIMWTVLPEQKAYMESDFDLAKVPRAEEKVRGEVERKLVGSETIDGYPTRKYEVTYKDKELNSTMYQWMATDLNFPIRTAGIDGTWMVEYKNITFELPAGYRKMDMPNLGNILSGARGEGAVKTAPSTPAATMEVAVPAPPKKSVPRRQQRANQGWGTRS